MSSFSPLSVGDEIEAASQVSVFFGGGGWRNFVGASLDIEFFCRFWREFPARQRSVWGTCARCYFNGPPSRSDRASGRASERKRECVCGREGARMSVCLFYEEEEEEEEESLGLEEEEVLFTTNY